MKILIGFVAMFLMLSSTAVCDEQVKFARISFIKELGVVDIKALSLVNVGDYIRTPTFGVDKNHVSFLAKNYGLFLGSKSYGPIELEETIRSNKIKVRIEYEEAKAFGQCGANPPAIFNLWFNGKLVIKNVLFHQECFGRPSIDEAIVYIDDRDLRLNLTIAKNNWGVLLKVPFIHGFYGGEFPIDEDAIERKLKLFYPKLYKFYQN